MRGRAFIDFLKDNVRAIALSCLGISASGWLTFVIAFGTQLLSLDPIINALGFLFVPWYIAAGIGPIMYVLVGVYMLLGKYFKFAKIFQSVSIFCIIVYIGVLAAPMFFVAALFASAAAGIDEALNAIVIPDLSDAIDSAIGNSVDLGPLNSVIDTAANALDDLLSILTDFFRGVVYFILIIIFDQFISGIKAQFIGSFTSIVFLGFTVMLWPFIKKETREHKKLC